MTYTETANIYSEVLDTTYIIGKLNDNQYTYIWTNRSIENGIIPEAALTSPTAEHGAMVGNAEEIREEFENCVGSFRYWGDEVQAEAAQEVVDSLEEGLK